MNASGADQSPDGTYLTNDASRRTFLKGVGLSGAAGLASAAGLTGPFLATSSARADSSGGIILGIQAPGPWPGGDQAPAGLGWEALIPRGSNYSGRGCRSYRDKEFAFNAVDPNHPDVEPVAWSHPQALGLDPQTGKAIFPGEEGSIPLASIRPQPSVLMTGQLDGKIKDMIHDGALKAASGYFKGTPQLTVWHEAGHLYSNYAQLNPDQNPASGVPRNVTAATNVRQMHVYMKNLVQQVNTNPDNAGLPNVEYGCIIFGDINKMANDNNLQGATNWVPTKDYPMDWYGIDLYYEDDTAFDISPDCTHGDLDGWLAVKSHLDTFKQMASGRANGAPLRINVCECNANSSHDAKRPDYFFNLATWLYSDPAGHRMLTFFHDPDKTANHSVTWLSVADPSNPTVQRLNTIQGTFGH